MTKKELNENIYNNFSDEIEKEQSDIILDSIIEGLEELLINDFECTIKNYGKLAIKDNKSRISTNPSTGEKMETPESRSVKLKMTASAKEGLNS